MRAKPRTTCVSLTVLVLALPLSPAMAASPGDSDMSFGVNGSVITALGAGAEATDVVEQPDGRFIVAAQVYIGAANYRNAVLRYGSDGNLDSSFGSAGVAWQPAVLSRADAPPKLALQSDGSIVEMGCLPATSGSSEVFYLTRFTAAGGLDTNFGHNGEVKQSISQYPDCPTALAIQTDGKIIVAGYTARTVLDAEGLPLVMDDIELGRFLPNGALDPEFGTAGKAITTSLRVGLREPAAVLVQSDGKTVVPVRSLNPDGENFGEIIRYNPDGSLDTSYGGSGVVGGFRFVGDFTWGIYAASLQADGKLLIAGFTNPGVDFDDGNRPFVARLGSDGTLDASFGQGGVAREASFHAHVFLSLIRQADGRTVLGGLDFYGRPSCPTGFTLTRFDTSGRVDATLDGVCPTGMPSPSALFSQADGKIVAAGFSGSTILGFLRLSIVFPGSTSALFRAYGGTCGNGLQEAGEDCDDGNTRNGDCCSSSCRFEPTTTTCVASGCVVRHCNGAGMCTLP